MRRYVLESISFFMLQELKLWNPAEPAPYISSKEFLCFSRSFWINKTRSLSTGGGGLVCHHLNLAAIFHEDEKVNGSFNRLGGNKDSVVLSGGA
jgi:hypothetical protein